jgi:NAD(P)-dependent dehydrogenase (short-subunit alcohol dehydrogenase family)
MTGIFKGKVALVTGAASGIGAAATRMFASEGAAVVITDLQNGVEEMVLEIEQQGGRATALVGDVSDPDNACSLVDMALEKFGRLDFAFNNAGIGGRPCPIEELTEEEWTRVININLNSVFFGIKYQIPAMLKSGGGVIVNNSSVLGLKPIPGQSLEYTAAKHGVIGLTRQVAVNYAADGIRCVAVCPGFIETPLTGADIHGHSRHEGKDWFVSRTPMARSGQPEEIAGAVRMLCSDDASFVNGASLQVDGGFLLS